MEVVLALLLGLSLGLNINTFSMKTEQNITPAELLKDFCDEDLSNEACH